MTNRSLGMILLCIWLILTGVLSVTNITFAAASIIMGVLAIAAGIFVLLGK